MGLGVTQLAVPIKNRIKPSAQVETWKLVVGPLEVFLAAARLSSPGATFMIFLDSRQPHQTKVPSFALRIQLNIDAQPTFPPQWGILTLLCSFGYAVRVPNLFSPILLCCCGMLLPIYYELMAKPRGALWHPNGSDG